MGSKRAVPFKRVVVLGATGFLGRSLMDLFRQEGIEAVGYGSKDMDLRRIDALSALDDRVGSDTALIVASALTPEKGATLEVLEANLAMSLNVARYLERHPVGLCVYVSSDAVYPMRYSPVTEETPVDPSSLYALAKYTGERALARVFETAGLPLLTLRMTALYGPGDTHGSYGPNQFMRTILKDGQVRLFGEGEEQRDHLYIGDAVRLVAELVHARATGLYNLASGRSCSFAHVVEALRGIVNKPFVVQFMPRKAPVTHRHFDMTRLFLAVPGFRFTSLEEGLRRYYEAAGQ